jgi:hypothetical protein
MSANLAVSTSHETPALYSDWFLPSLNEMNAMYSQLYQQSVGGFSADSYWTSSETDSATAYGANFSTGQFAAQNKGNTYRVRACREFTSASPSYSVRDIGPAGGLICYKDNDYYLEAAVSDQSVAQAWSNVTNQEAGSIYTAIGWGSPNTSNIINQVNHNSSAAKLCDDLVA